MTDFFKFSQVEAPNLTSTARFMQNAQSAIDSGFDAFGSAISTYKQEVETKQDRIKTDNTNNYLARIAAASSLDEVNSMKASVGSDEFLAEYPDGRYIDTDKIIKALDSKPQGIAEEAAYDLAIKSTNQDEAAGGYLAKVSSTTNLRELDAVAKLAGNTNLSSSHNAKILKAIQDQRTLLDNKLNADRNFSIANSKIKEDKQREEFERDLTQVSSQLAVSQMGTGTTDDQATRDAQAVRLSQMYGIPLLVVKERLNNNVSSLVTGQRASLDAAAVAAMTDAERTAYIQTVTGIKQAGVDAVANYDAMQKAAQSGQTGNIQSILDSPKVPPERVQEIIKDGVSKGVSMGALAHVDEELLTESFFIKLSTISKQEDADAFFKTVMGDYVALKENRPDMEVRRIAYTAYVKKEADAMEVEQSRIANDSYKVGTQLKQAQENGEDTTKLLSEQAYLFKAQNALTEKQVALTNSANSFNMDWALSPVGQKNMSKQVHTATSKGSIAAQKRMRAELYTTYGFDPKTGEYATALSPQLQNAIRELDNSLAKSAVTAKASGSRSTNELATHKRTLETLRKQNTPEARDAIAYAEKRIATLEKETAKQAKGNAMTNAAK